MKRRSLQTTKPDLRHQEDMLHALTAQFFHLLTVAILEFFRPISQNISVEAKLVKLGEERIATSL